MSRNRGRITRRQFSRYSMVAAGAVAAGGLPLRGLRAQQPALKVGVITSLSGANIFGGNLTRRGYDLWAETVNQQGGVEIGGQRYPVEMFYGDDQSNPATGADAAERLIVGEEVDALFGPYTSGVTLAVQPICEKYQVPMISGSAESPNVWKARPEFNFGMIPAVDNSAGQSIEVLTNLSEPKATTIAVIGINEPFSLETAEGFQAGAEEIGLEVLAFELVPATGDMTPVISKIAALNPDIVAVGGHEAALINTVKASRSLNFRPKSLIMHYGVTIPAFAQELGGDADGTSGIAVWLPSVPYEDSLFGTAEDYSMAAYNRWGSYPDYTEAACSASGLVLGDAVRRLGIVPPFSAEDKVALKDAIAATDITTFYGPVKFEQDGDHYHDNIQPSPVLIQIKDGAVVAVGPEEAAAAEFTYPLPAWQ
ncbi:amino acid ABC transporter substrate-binding protein [Inquilinus sp. CAU 1745]|uniref:amino acid ABC transporter substrate-binding protein n=1 Tax=Inquilinus sp. CAU 1745 TaxID=3140369 RepID=UPI00325A74EB